jgi:arylsulfatase A-like enzyme
MTSEKATRKNVGIGLFGTRRRRLLGLIGLIVLFAGETGWSLWSWQRTNRNGLLAATRYSVVFLAFFWTSLLVAMEVFSHVPGWLERKAGRFLGLSAAVGVVIVVALGWVLTVSSLSTRYVLGFYLNLPLLQFARANVSHGLWAHMVKSQHWMLIGLMGFLLASVLWVIRKGWQARKGVEWLDEVGRRRVLVVWLALTAGFTFSTAALNREENKVFKARMTNHLCYNLDPLITFGLSCYDLRRQAQYESVLLEESELRPRWAPFSQPAAAMREKPNIVCFQVESFRADLIGEVSQGIEVVPNINRLAREGTWFKKAYAPASHTSLSNPSIPSSLYPLRKDMLVSYQATDPWPKTLIYDVLKPYGYANAWISSDFESWCGMDTFLITPALDLFVDSATRKLKELGPHAEQAQAANIQVELVPDRLTANTALEWMDMKLKQKQPFYINISLNDSHFPYRSSNKDAHWFQPNGVAAGWTFNDYPRERKDQVRNTYLNAIHGIDLLIGEMLEFLHQRGADENTIVVVFGDHGEAFFENGFPSHATLPYDPCVHTGLILWGKRYFEAKAEDYPTSLIDAVPTVLARLGLEPHPNFQGVDVLCPNRVQAERRCLYLHVDGLVNGDGLVAGGRWKYFEDNAKGDCYLFDLESDPGESRNIVEQQPGIAELLGAQLAAWRTAQLAYYRSERYYGRFFPPPPRMLPDLRGETKLRASE